MCLVKGACMFPIAAGVGYASIKHGFVEVVAEVVVCFSNVKCFCFALEVEEASV